MAACHMVSLRRGARQTIGSGGEQQHGARIVKGHTGYYGNGLTFPSALCYRIIQMSQDRASSPNDCEVEGLLLPSSSVPQPLTSGLERTSPHPLLDISLTPDKGGGILRRKSSERRQGQRQVRFEVSDESKPRSNDLESPRMHSSEALRLEVQRESVQAFNAERALRSRLDKSYRARRSVESQASRAVNVCRVQSLYQGLVSVEPPAEQIQILTKKQRQAEHRQVNLSEGPDLFAFCNPSDHFTETPYLSVDGLPPLTLHPHSRPSHTSFNMFHKLREWTS
ncbi:protein phosphatase 1 regulatory subunit 35 [Pelodytes ibericus]